MKKTILSFLLSSVVGLGGNTAWAQYGSNYGTTGTDVVGAGLGVGLLIFWIIFMLVGLALGIFWIWMLVDCIKRRFDQKTLWIVLLIILGWIGAIAYYFVIKRKNVGGSSGSVTPSQTTPPASPPQSPPASPPQA